MLTLLTTNTKSQGIAHPPKPRSWQEEAHLGWPWPLRGQAPRLCCFVITEAGAQDPTGPLFLRPPKGGQEGGAHSLLTLRNDHHSPLTGQVTSGSPVPQGPGSWVAMGRLREPPWRTSGLLPGCPAHQLVPGQGTRRAPGGGQGLLFPDSPHGRAPLLVDNPTPTTEMASDRWSQWVGPTVAPIMTEWYLLPGNGPSSVAQQRLHARAALAVLCYSSIIKVILVSHRSSLLCSVFSILLKFDNHLCSLLP